MKALSAALLAAMFAMLTLSAHAATPITATLTFTADKHSFAIADEEDKDKDKDGGKKGD